MCWRIVPSDLPVFDPMIQLFRMVFLFMPEVLFQVIRFRSRQHFRMEFMPEVLFSNAQSSHV